VRASQSSGKKLLVESSLQVSDTFGATGTALRADHALDHLDVMRTPKRKVLIVLQQSFG